MLIHRNSDKPQESHRVTVSPCPITRCAVPLKLICRPLESRRRALCPSPAASVSALFGTALSALCLWAPVCFPVCVFECLCSVLQMFIR